MTYRWFESNSIPKTKIQVYLCKLRKIVATAKLADKQTSGIVLLGLGAVHLFRFGRLVHETGYSGLCARMRGILVRCCTVLTFWCAHVISRNMHCLIFSFVLVKCVQFINFKVYRRSGSWTLNDFYDL